MDKRTLGTTGIMVTPVGFGVLPIGKTQLDLPLDQGAEVLRYAMDRGINFLDTAQYYDTYSYIRAALKGSNYDPVISSKCLGCTYKEMDLAIEEARRELDRDIIDIFLLHEVRHNNDFENRSGAWDRLNEAKVKGIVKAVGVSTHHVDVAQKMAGIEECDVIFPLINFRSLGIRCGSGQGSKEDMAEAIFANHLRGNGVFVMKAFGGGNLTGHYQEALDYVYGLAGVDSVMIGFGNFKEVDDIFLYLDGGMKKDYKPDTSGKKMHIDQGDCEGCGLCVIRCPNQAIYKNESGRAQINEDICLTCGYCAPQCPVRAIIMW